MTDHPFDVVVAAEAARVVVRVHGELDMATVPTLLDALIALRRTGFRCAVVDLSEVTFMDGSGVDALVAARSFGLELTLVGASGTAALVLVGTGLLPGRPVGRATGRDRAPRRTAGHRRRSASAHPS